MAKTESKIQDIQEHLWDLVIYYYKNRDIRKEIFSTEKGKKFLKELHSNNLISKFQWNYESNGIHDLLEHYYIDTFLKKIRRIAINLGISKENSNNPELREQFDIQFEDLENKILLSDNFEYFIYIPVFRVTFPQNVKKINFDANHILRDISEEKEPYGITEFKKIPQSWNRIWKDPPNASFEVKFSIKKKLSTEKPYENRIHPVMPNDPYSKYNILTEKITSIYEFFLCYGNKFDLDKATFGDKFYLKLPSFSLPFREYDSYYIYSEFPTPQSYLSLRLPKDHPGYIDWEKRWKDNYLWFYKTFYENDPIFNDTYNFRYALEVLRTSNNIYFPRVKAFLLVSTLEGLLYDDKILKKSKKIQGFIHSKKFPVAVAFLKLSEYKNQYWQHVFQSKYPLKTPLSNFATKDDLKEFIISSFNYRNTIAHVLDMRNYKIEPLYLRGSEIPDYMRIEYLINDHFPYFLIFVIRLWLEAKKESKMEWIKFLIKLF